MDIDQLRRDTPGCSSRIHFNNAGASLMPSVVTEAMAGHIALEAQEGGYEAADIGKEKIAAFYPAVAKLIGANARNIAYASSATNAYARALSSIPFQPGDTVMVSGEDYISNQLAFLAMSKRLNISLIRIPIEPDGGVDPSVFREMAIRHRPRLVSLTHVPTNSGLIQPAVEIGQICRELGIHFILDACQSAGQLPLDVNEIGCDFLSATFRKYLRGPRGAGFLYVSDRILNSDFIPLFIDMRGAQWTSEDEFIPRGDATRFEDWEMPYALVMGARAAAAYACETGIEKIATRNTSLTERLHSALHDIGLKTYDPVGRRCALVTTHIPGQDPDFLMRQLRSQGINTSVSYRNFALPDMNRKGLPWVLRISPHYYNTTDEIEQLIAVLRTMVKS